MSGFIVVALAGLLMQDAGAVHPSTLRLYQPPAIRPFEPPSDFGREPEQGDAEEAAHRAEPLAPVAVAAYDGDYEYAPSAAEAAYSQGVAAAELRMDATAGPLDGAWRAGEYRLVLRDPGAGRPVEGAWARDGRGGAAVVEGERVVLRGAGVTLERRALSR
jgi:hypothetical protein